MLFNFELFDIKMDTDYIGRNFIYSEEVDSTNALLLKKEYTEHGTVALAEKQLKGRGRKDRVWSSAREQNLTFSVLITDKALLKSKVGLINFAASLSVSTAIENLFQLKPELKWPNDVLINGKKLAGILLESTSKGATLERIVLGIGLNVNQNFFPGNFDIPPTSVKSEINQHVDREHLLSEVLNNLEETLEALLQNPQSILRDWRLRCRMIGERITIVEEKETKYGIFDDVDDEGFLILRNRNKIEKIHYGDVSLR
jgi:BirA family transcriptional regulator, biotin operon repressor / biotin---[acetyl-CoA-carboxylase] ligase